MPKEALASTPLSKALEPSRPGDRTLPNHLPRVWVLTTLHAGDRKQMLGLAEALGWPFEEKRLQHNRWRGLPNLLLGASRLSLDAAKSDALTPPWPDLVIASGGRCVPTARWIRRRSGGHTRLVHIGRPWAPLTLFDLVVTTPQYGLPRRPNLLTNAVTLNRLDPADLEETARAWAPRVAQLPAPRVAVIVGGDARPFYLDATSAKALGQRVDCLAGELGASLLVSTSKRTLPEAVDSLFAAILRPAFLHRWSEGGDNPYSAFLALADVLVVTGDSASMLSEAVATGKPVHIFEMPERPDFRLRTARALRRLANGGGLGAWAYRSMVNLGLVTSTRDMAQFHQQLIDRGLATRLGQAAATRIALDTDPLVATVARIRVLLGRGPTDGTTSMKQVHPDRSPVVRLVDPATDGVKGRPTDPDSDWKRAK